ncbi:MAG TPA: sterol desaturase family protein [Inquilinus sp.]|nr:sterol desaturase family protein [Inquilinus sp.]
MHLTRWVYYVDFFAYPVVLFGLAGGALATIPPAAWLFWFSTVGIGLFAWTLIEYIAHRAFLHHIPVLAAMHDQHHRRPSAMIGTPIWISGALLGVAFLALWALLGLDLASGVSAGLVAGYLWYVVVHHKSHHARPDPASYLYRAKRRHGLHHHGRLPGNFGVTTALWDHVFRTAVEADRRS